MKCLRRAVVTLLLGAAAFVLIRGALVLVREMTNERG